MFLRAFAAACLLMGAAKAGEALTWLDLQDDDTSSPFKLLGAEETPEFELDNAGLISGRPYPFLYASGEVIIAKVDARTGGRVTLSHDDSGTAGTEQAFLDGDGLEQWGAGPRFTLGTQIFQHLSFQGRVFYLSDAVASRGVDRNPAFAPPLPTFNTVYETDSLEAYNIDLELLYNMQVRKTKIDFIVGAQQAHYNVQSIVHSFGVVTTGNFANLLLSNGCGFDGFGHTYGIQLRRQIAETPLTVYFAARGSRADGQTDSFGRSAGTIVSNPSPPLSGAATVTRANADAHLNLTEIQAGLQWERELVAVPATVFVRTGYEWQYWDLNAPPTGGAGFGGTIGTLTTNSFSSAGIGDMKIGGLAISTGINW